MINSSKNFYRMSTFTIIFIIFIIYRLFIGDIINGDSYFVTHFKQLPNFLDVIFSKEQGKYRPLSLILEQLGSYIYIYKSYGYEFLIFITGIVISLFGVLVWELCYFVFKQNLTANESQLKFICSLISIAISLSVSSLSGYWHNLFSLYQMGSNFFILLGVMFFVKTISFKNEFNLKIFTYFIIIIFCSVVAPLWRENGFILAFFVFIFSFIYGVSRNRYLFVLNFLTLPLLLYSLFPQMFITNSFNESANIIYNGLQTSNDPDFIGKVVRGDVTFLNKSFLNFNLDQHSFDMHKYEISQNIKNFNFNYLRIPTLIDNMPILFWVVIMIFSILNTFSNLLILKNNNGITKNLVFNIICFLLSILWLSILSQKTPALSNLMLLNFLFFLTLFFFVFKSPHLLILFIFGSISIFFFHSNHAQHLSFPIIPIVILFFLILNKVLDSFVLEKYSFKKIYFIIFFGVICSLEGLSNVLSSSISINSMNNTHKIISKSINPNKNTLLFTDSMGLQDVAFISGLNSENKKIKINWTHYRNINANLEKFKSHFLEMTKNKNEIFYAHHASKSRRDNVFLPNVEKEFINSFDVINYIFPFDPLRLYLWFDQVPRQLAPSE